MKRFGQKTKKFTVGKTVYRFTQQVAYGFGFGYRTQQQTAGRFVCHTLQVALWYLTGRSRHMKMCRRRGNAYLSTDTAHSFYPIGYSV